MESPTCWRWIHCEALSGIVLRTYVRHSYKANHHTALHLVHKVHTRVHVLYKHNKPSQLSECSLWKITTKAGYFQLWKVVKKSLQRCFNLELLNRNDWTLLKTCRFNLMLLVLFLIPWYKIFIQQTGFPGDTLRYCIATKYVSTIWQFPDQTYIIFQGVHNYIYN